MTQDKKDPAGTGYGKPPVRGQFKPGQSGNPRGRPRQGDQLQEALTQALLGRVNVQIEGKAVQLSRVEAICTQALMRGEAEDLKLVLRFLKLVRREVPAASSLPKKPSGVMWVPGGCRHSLDRWENVFGPDRKLGPSGA